MTTALLEEGSKPPLLLSVDRHQFDGQIDQTYWWHAPATLCQPAVASLRIQFPTLKLLDDRGNKDPHAAPLPAKIMTHNCS